MTIGQRIKELRTARSLSQEYVAIRMGVSRQAVSKWETDSAMPDTYNLIALAELFEVSVESIVSTDGDAPVDVLINEVDVKSEKKKKTGLFAGTVCILIGIALVLLCYLGEQVSSRFIPVYEMLTLLPMILSPLWMLFYKPAELATDKKSLRKLCLRSLIYALIIEVVCASLFVGYYLLVYSYRLLEYHYSFIWPLVVLQVNMWVLLELAVQIPLLTRKRFGQPLRIVLYLLLTLLLIPFVAALFHLISPMTLNRRIVIMGIATAISAALFACCWIWQEKT